MDSKSYPIHSGLLTKSAIKASSLHDLVHEDSVDDSSTEDQVMLTTVDNPYNPFTNFDEWFAFDENEGYHSTALLARIAISSEELSEADQILDYEDAIDEIVRENVSGVHKKVYRNGANNLG